MLVIIALFAAVAGLNVLAGMETRWTGSPRWTSKLFFAVIAGVFYLFYLDDTMVSSRGAETVRLLLNLPDDMAIGRIRGGDKNPVCYRRSETYRTIVEFAPDQFERYVASVHDRSLWRPVVPPHYLPHKSRLQFADDAVAWEELPEPGWLGRQQLVWKVAGSGVRRGLALCYTINRVDQQAQMSAGALISHYTVTKCNARARTKTPVGGGHVAAALDFDKQQLVIAMTFGSKPDYCNNRVTKWLGAALGLETK